uniref:LuxR C-terminal-related transcriptional regulator n=1 Tax=Burkholderia alba TaxID=2683677 RepID=UPI002B05FA7A|nr:LuxR C-terminal-related transcriptional regulator [Burkholderia alba]
MDRYEDADATGRDGLRRLPSCKPFADSVLINTMASVVSVMGESPEAHRLLDAARAGRGTSDFVRTYTEAMEGLLDLQEGRLRQATARFRMVLLGQADGNGYRHHSGNAWAGVLYASVIYEMNRLDEAEHWLNIYLPLARDVSLPDHMIASHAIRARIAFLRGDIDAAVRVLTELEYLGHHRHLPRVVCSAKLERAHMLMLQGNAQASREELERANDSALWARVSRQRLPAHETDDMIMGSLRWDILFGDAHAALPRIAHELARAEAATRRRRVFKLRVLQALALQRSGDPSGARREMAELLQQTYPEGFMRLILDEGEPVSLLLHRLHAHRIDTGAPLFDDYLQGLLAAAGPMPLLDAEILATAAPVDPLAEPLTRKEIRVLQLLAEGYSNNAMAEKLFVSDSTVRTHLRNINTKLGAKSRTQAVAIARKRLVIQ